MMGKKPPTSGKWKLELLFCVVLFLITSSAANIYKASPVFIRKSSGIKLSTDTGSTKGASSLQLLPNSPLVHQFQSDYAHSQLDIAALADVSVDCARSDLVVRVKPAFYGLGADASELRLGSDFMCQSNGVFGPYGDLLFKYPLKACGSELERLPGYLVYKFVLHYDPSPKRFPNMDPVAVNIECRYPRNYHLHKLAIQPTWESHIAYRMLKASQTNFQIQLMDDTWQNPVQFRVFRLREIINFQVSALHLPLEQKLYINSCYATPVTHPTSQTRFPIIDNYGCFVDSKTNPGSSKFISRTDESVRFSIKAFQFVTNPTAEISMHCQLYVTNAGPSHTHKSCTYMANRWKALSGDDAICQCCESQCVTSKPHGALMDDIISSRSLWVSSHSGATETKSGVHKIHNTRDETKNPELDLRETKIVKQKEETSGVTDQKMVKKKWSTDEDEKVKVVDGKKGSQKPVGGNVKGCIKKVFEQENSGDDEMDGKKTWFFAW